MQSFMIYIAPLLGIALICSLFMLGYLVLKVRREGRFIKIFCAALLAWMVFFSLEIMLASPGAKVLFKQLEYALVHFLPSLLFLSIYEYPHDSRVDKTKVIIALALPTLFSLLVLTNSLHNLYFANVTLSDTHVIHENSYGFNGFILFAGGMNAVSVIQIGTIAKSTHARYLKSLRLLQPLPFISYAALIVGVLLNVNYCIEVMQLGAFIVLLIMFILLVAMERPYLHMPHQKVLSVLPMAYIALNKAGLVVDLNLVAQRVIGKAEDVLGIPIEEALYRWSGRRIIVQEHEMLEVKIPVGPYFEYYELVYTEQDGAGVLSMLNTTAHKLDQEQKSYFANIDLLTGLPSRALFDRLLLREFDNLHRYNDMLALLSISVKNLEEVSTQYGLALADRLVRDLGGILRDLFRDVDTIARMEDDTFFVMLPKIKNVEENMQAILARMNTVFSVPIKLASEMIKIDLCIGVAVAPQDGNTPEELSANASIARYYASIKDCPVHYYSETQNGLETEQNTQNIVNKDTL